MTRRYIGARRLPAIFTFFLFFYLWLRQQFADSGPFATKVSNEVASVGLHDEFLNEDDQSEHSEIKAKSEQFLSDRQDEILTQKPHRRKSQTIQDGQNFYTVRTTRSSSKRNETKTNEFDIVDTSNISSLEVEKLPVVLGKNRNISKKVVPTHGKNDWNINDQKKTVDDSDMDYIGDENLIFVREIAKKNFQRKDTIETVRTNQVEVIQDLNVLTKPPRSHNSKLRVTTPASFPYRTQNPIKSRTNSMEPDVFDEMPKVPDYELPFKNQKLDAKDEEVPISPKLDISKTKISIKPVQNFGSSDENSDNNDEAMEGVLVLGEVNMNKRYAVFSTTTENRESLNFLFLVPLTALVWQRIGFDSVVIIVGSPEEWNNDPLYNYVLSSVRKLDAVVIFLEPRPDKSVMISQVSRLFAANILRLSLPVDRRAAFDNVYFITTDADLWPIYENAYVLPHRKAILSLNADCCGAFSHRGASYRMLPMANIGMSAGIWRNITRKFGQSPSSIDDILTYFVQEFGSVALRPAHKGDNVGWFLDQMMVSLLIANWVKNYGNDAVKFSTRDVGLDRIDRAGWNPGNNIDDKIDAHLLTEAYIPGVWVRLTHILRLLFGDMSDNYNWCVDYYENFQTLFLDKYRKGSRGS